MDRLKDYLKTHAVNDVVQQDVLNEAAMRFGLTHRLLEKAALESGVLPVRYQRNRNTLSIEQQLALFQSRVAVVGCGGLGGYLIEELARLGVGTIVAIDPDKFEEHNLNRQILCTLETIGSPKVAAAADRVQKINPAVTLVPVRQA
ncbi:MAG TPA: ThiF family adenylyltransferase, partial [Dissulfurispiraceae bacterium]|nr:ThiF family adenylyltransferase [Dissulfurispiraceae bacterium]